MEKKDKFNIANIASIIGAILVIQGFIVGIFITYGKIRDKVKMYDSNTAAIADLNSRMQKSIESINGKFDDDEYDINNLKKEIRDLKIRALGLEKINRAESKQLEVKKANKYIFF